MRAGHKRSPETDDQKELQVTELKKYGFLFFGYVCGIISVFAGISVFTSRSSDAEIRRKFTQKTSCLIKKWGITRKRSSSSDSGSTYDTSIVFEYSYNNKMYSDTNKLKGLFGKEYNQFKSEFRDGTKHTCLVNPQKPEQAMLAFVIKHQHSRTVAYKIAFPVFLVLAILLYLIGRLRYGKKEKMLREKISKTRP